MKLENLDIENLIDIDLSNWLPTPYIDIFKNKIYNTVYEYIAYPHWRGTCTVKYISLDINEILEKELVIKKLSQVFCCLCDLELVKGVMVCCIIPHKIENKYHIFFGIATKLNADQLNVIFKQKIFCEEGSWIDNFDLNEINDVNFKSNSFKNWNYPQINSPSTIDVVVELLNKDNYLNNLLKNKNL